MHEKGAQPSSAGCVDRFFFIPIIAHMSSRAITSGLLKALTILAFALALVFSPPSAVHAASGMHDAPPAMSMSSPPAQPVANSAASAHAGHAMHVTLTDSETTGPGNGDKEQQANQCCSGICFSVIALDEEAVFPLPTPVAEYSILDVPSRSVDKIGFMRPPRVLI